MEQGDKPPAPGSDLPRKTPARKFDFSSSAFAGNPIAEAVAAAINRALQAIPQSQPRPHPQPQPQPTKRFMNPETSMIRRASFHEGLRSTLKMKKCCNCRHSQCLKLYCECFASGGYCDGCNCTNCFNNAENEAARRDAVDATRELNPDAFKPKIDNINQDNSANRK